MDPDPGSGNLFKKRFLRSQPGSGVSFRVEGAFLNAITSFLNRVSDVVSKKLAKTFYFLFY